MSAQDDGRFNNTVSFGGPLPLPGIGENTLARDMTIRDHFAAMALQAFIARADLAQNMAPMGNDAYDDLIARWSYESADAMLKARLAGMLKARQA